MKAQVGTCAWGIPSRKSGIGAREIQRRQVAVESQFWGSPKALEGQRQRAGTEEAREGAEVHSHSWGAWLCAQHLVYVINPHYNPSKSVPHHPHFTDKEAKAWRTARIVKSISQNIS